MGADIVPDLLSSCPPLWHDKLEQPFVLYLLGKIKVGEFLITSRPEVSLSTDVQYLVGFYHYPDSESQ